MPKDSIDKFINQKEKKQNLQVPISVSLYENINEYRVEKGLTWPELIEALFKRLIAEIDK